ncbi:Hydroxymethylpyrimidine/phosphomethylpyrimidine kinase [Roseovarius albus]|uniref:hydroxymethylpyrimidine kinase n=1 Tax=Roseovarius albus TaxID=1247867 RepID=A0A1X6YY42_9RHOB|nr:bifunctional hydroxymethylpyrimidine kinase/phosphomethylpyrimidine kinase [Roseovarius albus]SLN34258.1 Hydroxymethylpyrimidine/phosphomethylpyrimidine kinase [Roseovarius albus]
MKRVLIIGGSDSSGGAGLTRDTAVAHEFNCLAKPVVTCVTAQTNAAVHLVHELPAPVIASQIHAALADGPPDAIKIGMVGSKDATNAIADALTGCVIPIVIDPVLKASSGGRLGDETALARLIQMSRLLTPNLIEAGALTKHPIARSEAEIITQASMILKLGAKAVLIKGGHSAEHTCCDHLVDKEGKHKFCLPRLEQEKRGTGCSLATVVACEIAWGSDLREACTRAKEHIHEWISR